MQRHTYLTQYDRAARTRLGARRLIVETSLDLGRELAEMADATGDESLRDLATTYRHIADTVVATSAP